MGAVIRVAGTMTLQYIRSLNRNGAEYTREVL